MKALAIHSCAFRIDSRERTAHSTSDWALVCAVPLALADEVGVRVGPLGAGVTVGEDQRDYDRDRVRERTIIREREPSERTTIIKKDNGDGVESKTIIRHDND
jgi:hypothetical protein